MERKRRTGIYLTTRQVLDNPDYVPALRDGIGLNLAILSYTGEVSETLRRSSPFDGVPLSDPCLLDLVNRHMDGSPVDPLEFDIVRSQVGPGVGAHGNDLEFRQALDSLRQTGMEIWIGSGCWTARRLMFCPSHPATTDWFTRLYCELATRYDADGLDITHARYPMASFPRGLFSCTCQHCSAAATDLGFSMPAMIRALVDARQTLASAGDGRLAALAAGVGPMDFMQLLEMDPGVVDWLRFRAELLERRLIGFREAVGQAAGAEYIFGTDTHPASLSMFVGHNYAHFHRYSDFASPLVSHISAFVCDTFAVWARFLIEEQPSTGEREALELVYRLTGYEDMGLPQTLAGFDPGNPERLAHIVPLEELVMRDLRKARLLLSPELPSYPIIHGSGWPRAAIQRIVEQSDEVGHDGIVWQGTDELIDFELK
jgi:hypothetical protein